VLDLVADVLAQDGVDTIFGLVGGGNYALVTSLQHRLGLRFVAARHEAAAVSAADAYARLSGRLGVCTVTQGPGFTHALTALVESVKSRTPLVLLAGDMHSPGRSANQDIDQNGLALLVGADVCRIADPDEAEADVRAALSLARDSRRPVVVSLPIHVQDQAAPGQAADPAPVLARQRAAPDGEALARAAEMLAGAQRPVVLAGRGAAVAGAGAALRSVGDQVGALLATTVMARGLFAGDPWDLDVCGGFSCRATARLVSEADVVLAVGASLNSWTTRHGELLAGASVIHVDADPAAIGALHPAVLGVVADAAEVAEGLAHRLRTTTRQRLACRTSQTLATIRSGRPTPFEDAGTDDSIDPRTCMLELDRMLPRSRCVVVDGGHFSGFPVMYLTAPDLVSFTYAHGFQSVGLGLGNALGAAAAHPDRLTVAVIGDGGLMMTLGELDALRALGQPVLVIVLNDAAYGAELHHFVGLGLPDTYARLPPADFAAIARAHGASALTVRQVSDMCALEPWLADPDGLLLVDCKVNPEVKAEWLEHAFPASADPSQEQRAKRQRDRTRTA